MYKWYFGVHETPESKAEAIARMALGFCGGGTALAVLLILIVRWWLV